MKVAAFNRGVCPEMNGAVGLWCTSPVGPAPPEVPWKINQQHMNTYVDKVTQSINAWLENNRDR